MRNILYMAVLAAGFAGCVGGIDSPTGTDNGSGSNTGSDTGSDTGSNTGSNTGSGDNPGTPTSDAGKASKKLFDDNVYPALIAHCNSCHKEAGALANAPAFVATSAASGYSIAVNTAALIGDLTATGAPILALITRGHQGAQYTSDEVTKITAWLAAETTARADGMGGGDANSPAAKQSKIESDWSACMSLANFTTANMIIWASVNSNDGNGNATCGSCHNTGYEGFTANGVAATGFEIISSERLQMKQYFTIDSTTAPTKMIVNTTNLNAVATGTAGHEGHRRFNLTNNNGLAAMNALNAFYTSTMAAVTAGNCGPTKLK